jgi:hypothetical protein
MEKIDVSEETVQDLNVLRDTITKVIGQPTNYDMAIQLLISMYKLAVDSLPPDFPDNIIGPMKINN